MTDIIACTPVHPLADGEVRLLGAVEQVTGAMTRVEMAGKKILVDCGIAQGREADQWEMPDAARDIDALILTHGHLDHIGSVPALIERGFNKPILATKSTLDIARISLDDSLGMAGASDKEIERFMARFNQLAKNVAYDNVGGHIAGFKANVAFRDAGHILGSSSVELVSDRSRVIVSGDLGRHHSPILRDPFTNWSNHMPVDVVVMESTYGNRNHEHGHEDIRGKLETIVKDVAKRKAKLLIPAFAIGRTQVLLYFLNELVEAKRIPEVPVALDTPMGTLVTEAYRSAKKLFDKETLDKIAHGDDPLDFDKLFVVRRGGDSHRLVGAEGPMIVIAGSGMCSGGRILRHLKKGLPDPECTVLFVGHQSVGTKGRVIQEAKETGKKVYIEGEEVPVRCRIDTLRGLSAHADRDELLEWAGHIPNVKRLALHHGEVTAQHALVEYAKGKGYAGLPSQPLAK